MGLFLFKTTQHMQMNIYRIFFSCLETNNLEAWFSAHLRHADCYTNWMWMDFQINKGLHHNCKFSSNTEMFINKNSSILADSTLISQIIIFCYQVLLSAKEKNSQHGLKKIWTQGLQTLEICTFSLTDDSMAVAVNFNSFWIFPLLLYLLLQRRELVK